ncbi:chalcone synthase B, partial [Aureobasidium melanogenum]
MFDYSDNHGAGSVPLSTAEMDYLFHTAGVDMTVQACNKAIEEWTGNSGDITHTVAVTCTNQGNPGFDVLINKRLGLSTSVERILLHGVGCAGGLAIMRTAAQLACGATMRGRPARILCFACELSTPNIRYELDAVANCAELSQVSIAGALFSDAAAAFVLCNDLELHCGIEPVFELLDWTTAIIPGTINELGFRAEAKGYRTVLNRSVPKHAISAVPPTFDKLLSLNRSQTDCQNLDVVIANLLFEPDILKVTTLVDYDCSHTGHPLHEYFFPSFSVKYCIVSAEPDVASAIFHGYPSPLPKSEPISSPEARDDDPPQWELMQLFEQELTSVGAARPRNIPAAEEITKIYEITAEICPFHFVMDKWVEKQTEKKLQSCRQEQMEILDKALTRWNR